jgi:hypothetical protein
MYKIDYYMTKNQIDIIESSYKNWLNARGNSEIDDKSLSLIAELIRVCAQQSDMVDKEHRDLFHSLWKQRFEFEKIVMNELNKIK